MGLTGLEKLCEIRSKELVIAINALRDTAKAWNEAAQYHDASKLLTSVVIIHLSEEAKNISREEVLKTVNHLIAQGTLKFKYYEC